MVTRRIVRKSPSGPVIWEVGVSVRRQNTVVSPCLQQLNIGSMAPLLDGVDPIFVELTEPSPTLIYQARLDFDIEYFGDAVSLTNTVGFALERSIDNGATWSDGGATPFASSLQNIYRAANTGASRHFSLIMPPTLGSAFGIVEGTPSLRLRAVANRGNFDAGSQIIVSSQDPTGTLAINLQELNPN